MLNNLQYKSMHSPLPHPTWSKPFDKQDTWLWTPTSPQGSCSNGSRHLSYIQKLAYKNSVWWKNLLICDEAQISLIGLEQVLPRIITLSSYKHDCSSSNISTFAWKQLHACKHSKSPFTLENKTNIRQLLKLCTCQVEQIRTIVYACLYQLLTSVQLRAHRNEQCCHTCTYLTIP